MTWQSEKKMHACVPDRDQSCSLLCISIRSTTWIRWRPDISGPQARVHVHQPPRSQDSEKLGGGLGTTLRTHLIRGRLRLCTQESEIWCVNSVK